jgi:hypothetical protein
MAVNEVSSARIRDSLTSRSTNDFSLPNISSFGHGGSQTLTGLSDLDSSHSHSQNFFYHGSDNQSSRHAAYTPFLESIFDDELFDGHGVPKTPEPQSDIFFEIKQNSFSNKVNLINFPT